MIDRCSVDTDTQVLPTHYTHDTSAENFETLEFSAVEDTKLTHAAQRGKVAITRALAGDAEAMADLRRLHLTYWQHERRS